MFYSLIILPNTDGIDKVKYEMWFIVPGGGSPGDSDGKEFACSARNLGQSLGWEDPWRMKWQPSPVSLPGESHGQRSLAGYSP